MPNINIFNNYIKKEKIKENKNKLIKLKKSRKGLPFNYLSSLNYFLIIFTSFSYFTYLFFYHFSCFLILILIIYTNIERIYIRNKLLKYNIYI